MLENVIINVIVQFIPCIISFFLSRYSFDTLYELVKSKSPYKYTVPLIIPAETIIKKKKGKKKERKSSKFHCLSERTDFAAMFARYYFRGREYGETQLLQFSTRLQSAHKLRVTTFQLRCLSNRSRMHGLIRKNASFLNHITFRYIYIYTHSSREHADYPFAGS